jgi:hypothetical protein
MPDDLFAAAAEAHPQRVGGPPRSPEVQTHRIMTPPYETRADVHGDGALTLTGLPFPAGTRVEVVVRPVTDDATATATTYPLRGRPLRYDAPFGSVAEADWDVLGDRS